jgi:hypothetical protein
VGIDIGHKQWNTKELARLDLRRSGLACGHSDGLQIPYRPLTGGNTFGIPYAYQWVYTQPSRIEDRPQAIAQWPGQLRVEESAIRPVDPSTPSLRLVNRNPWKQSDLESASAGSQRSLGVFRAEDAATLEEYVNRKRKGGRGLVAKEMLLSTAATSEATQSPRLRMTFKVLSLALSVFQLENLDPTCTRGQACV